MDREKEIFNKYICKYCKYKDECDQNKFLTKIFKDRLTINCVKYEYTKEDLISLM